MDDPRDETPHDQTDDGSPDDLAHLQRPMDDPQTRPALDPDVDPAADADEDDAEG